MRGSASYPPFFFFFFFGEVLRVLTKITPRNFKLRYDKTGKLGFPFFFFFIVFVMRRQMSSPVSVKEFKVSQEKTKLKWLCPVTMEGTDPGHRIVHAAQGGK